MREQAAAHGIDHGLVIRLAENRGTGNEGVSPSFRCSSDIVYLDATIDFKQDLASRRVDPASYFGNFFQRMRNERLATKSRIDRHDQNQIDLVHHVIKKMQWRTGIEHQPGLAAVIANQLQRAVDVLGRFLMKTDDVRTGFGKIGNDAIDRFDHQMHIDRYLHVRADRFADKWSDGQIRHVMVIHHIEMNDVGSGSNDVAYFLAKTSEVG